MNERKLVQAFKTFFDKSVQPYVKNNESVMNDWRSFENLISSEPIDSSQLDAYLLRNVKGSQIRKSGQAFHKQQSNISHVNNSSPHGVTYPKKSLISYLQSFQSVLVKNQEKLQQLSKKDQGNTLTATGKRYY